MAPELSYLVASVILFSVMILAEAIAGNLQYSMKDLLGARDNLEPNSAAVGRCKRATQNMLESMIMFAPLVLVAVVTERTSDITALGAMVFFIARVVYAPSYWFGIPVLRTLAWAAGIIGILMILFQVLPFTGAA
ncbi:MAG: MAPEG family protein [Pseudomonadota bacterium]